VKPRTGSLTERSPGVWRLQTTSDPDAVTGETRRLSRTFRGTKPEATAELQRFVTESGAGLQGGSSVTVAVLLGSFMGTATLAPTTRQDWASLINRYLIPELGNVPLWKLTARDCDRMYQRLRVGGLGASRVRNAHVILHRAVAQAVRWGWITRNPVSDATRPEVPRSTVTPPNIDDVRLLLALAEETDPTLSCWLDIATSTGARRGEICALRWSDIDLERATVRIERSVAATTAAGVYIKTTKTDRFRLVSLTDRAVRSLTELLDVATSNAAEAGRPTSADDLVFTKDPEAKEPWRPELVTRRWERLRKRAGLEHVKLHGLRHFVATELLTAGIDLRTVSNRLGHARTSTTLDIYWAWVPAQDEAAAEHLDTVLGQPGGARE
jgi:integrase